MKTVDRARGRWRDILPRIGIDPRCLVNRHGPCPLCGGRDRFRFDDRDGSGSYYCNGCGAGTGLIMVQRKLDCDWKTAAAKVDEILGDAAPLPAPRPAPDNRARRLAHLEAVVAGAKTPGVVAEYLVSRGLTFVTPVLLGHPALEYFDDNNIQRGRYPAVVAPITGPDGRMQSVHCIWIGDIPGARKKTKPGVIKVVGGAVRLFDPAEHLGLAEGVENALAAYELFDVPTWAALTAGGIESFKVPAGVKHLTIFGDNDASYTGQRAAFLLAHRVVRDSRAAGSPIDVTVEIPDGVGMDWLDVLNRRTGRAA